MFQNHLYLKIKLHAYVGFLKKTPEIPDSELLSKDTASPLSHHVMASSNCFSSTQALAPDGKK